MNMRRHELLDVARTNCDLDTLRVGQICMTALTYDKSLIIHTRGQDNGTTRLVADVHTQNEHISVYREDGDDLLLYDGDDGIDDMKRDVFTEPMQRFELLKQGDLWTAQLSPHLINNRTSALAFIGIIGHYASIKQAT